jgi:phenylacetate-coenzyme A ligase PaaK-like adenylate-forming protein
MTERQVQLIEDFQPTIIMVTPSYMLAILDEFRAQGLDPRESSLKVGIFGAEPWTNAMRAEIEEAFDMHAVDIYGLSEVMGPGVANECVETKDGLHIWEDHFYPEIIDPRPASRAAGRREGELVFTSLTKEALPIIRYRTRDLTRLLPGTARTMRRMEKITGRSDDMIILRGVNVFPTQIEEQILKGKDALIFAIILTHLEELDEAIEAADDPALPPEQRLRRLVGTVLESYRGADNQHQVQLNATSALSDEQKAALTAIERRIVRRFSNVLRDVSPGLDSKERPLLMPVTMSLFGIMNWVYMWFREGGRITREDYADIATTLVLEGVKAVR